uniref:Uncharacterized protein n=1 Tax=Rhizophora mucronata TaxID=61149 RepID=A0A2P2R1W2_RHIMU
MILSQINPRTCHAYFAI